MKGSSLAHLPEPGAARLDRAVATDPAARTFHDQFVGMFQQGFPRLFRYLDRLSGDPELASDLAQETYVRLYQRKAMPDTPDAWVITVAMNLLRNTRTTERRRRELMTASRAHAAHADPELSPEQRAIALETRRRVRATLDRMAEREAQLLLLSAEGYTYRDIGVALSIHEASVGTLLARARASFRTIYQDGPDGL